MTTLTILSSPFPPTLPEKSAFVYVIKTLCITECPEPSLQPFIFDYTAAAWDHNQANLTAYQHNIS
ncbi:MAG: hypothetical protein ACK53Y_10025, partial [bacterium]